MNSGMSFGWKSRLAAVISATGLAGWLGYHDGYREEVENRLSVQTSGPVKTLGRGEMPARGGAGPAGLMELRSKEQLDSIPTHQALADSWALVRTMTPAEIQAALNEMPQEKDALSALDRQQISMLYYRWAQLDPEAAVMAQKESSIPQQTTLQGPALTGWTTRDPDAAFRWATEQGINPESLGYRFAQLLTAEEPGAALKKAAAYGAQVFGATLNSFARQMSSTTEGRGAFVALLGDMKEEDREEALENMTGSWSAKNPGEALAGLALPGLSEEEIQRLRKQVTEAWQIKDPAACVEAISQPGTDVSREDQIDAYARWTRSHPVEAAAWSEAKEQDAGFYADAFRRLASAYPSMGLKKGGTRDSGDPWQFDQEVPILRLHFERWQQRDSAAASQWLTQTTPELREQLTPKANDEAGQ